MFDDHTVSPEKGRSSAVVASSADFVTEQDPETSQLNFSESSSDGDTETNSDNGLTASKGKKQKKTTMQKGKRKTLIPKAGVSARSKPSKISNQQKQQTRMITSRSKDPGIDCDQLIVSTDNGIKTKGRKNKECKSGITTSRLTKARGLSSNKSQKGKSSTDHLSQDESDQISAQKEEVASGRSTRLKVNSHDVVHLVSDEQEPELAQQQVDDKPTKALSNVGLGSKIVAPRKRGREREASKAGIKNRSLTNNSIREKICLRDDAEKLEGENLIVSSSKVRSARVKSRANGKHNPTIPAQRAQHGPPQKGKLTPGTSKERENDQMSTGELQKPFFQPRMTRARRKLAQDEENKTVSTKLTDSQLQHILSDGGGKLHVPKTVSDYADITDDLLLDSSLFSFGDLSDITVDGEKSAEKGQITDGEPITIESEYNNILVLTSMFYVAIMG